MNKDEFYKVWSESPRESILNQYYYDYQYLNKLKQALNEIEKYINNCCVFVDETGYEKPKGYPKENFDAQEILEIIYKIDKDD